MRNLGLLFYKEYFKNLDFPLKDGKYQPELKENENKACLEQLFGAVLAHNILQQNPLVSSSFKLTTIYPGLLIGSGYNHEIGDQKNELKLGFFFDYTYGLPCIPGSSVKGALRDACEKDNGNYIKSIIEEIASGKRNAQEDLDTIKTLSKEFMEKSIAYFNPIDKTKKVSDKNPSHFINSVFNGIGFDGDNLPLKLREIFFDAFLIESQNEEDKFLANDYITPHHLNPLKSPKPIQFMKILPQVTFQFNFRLTDECCPALLKKELFRQILLDLGVGAKTNVGYGQFISYEQNQTNRNIQVASGRFKTEVDVNLNKNEEFTAKVIDESNGYFYFQFEANGKECNVEKKADGANKKLKDKIKVGDKVILKITSDYKKGKNNPNFQVFSVKGN